MKKHYAFMAAAMLFAFTSCGGNKTNKEADESADYDETEELVMPSTSMEDITPEEFGQENEAVEEEAEALEETKANTSSASATSSVDAARIVQLISEYKTMVNDYKSCIDKFKSGKIDLSTAMSLLDKAQSLQGELESMKDKMSPEQVKELTSLASTLADAAKKAAASVDVDDVKKKVEDKVNEKLKNFDPSSLLK